MPVGTGPSQGFWGRMMGQMPGMVNNLAQNYGDPSMQGAARGTAQLLGAPRRKRLLPGGKAPANTGGTAAQVPQTGGGLQAPPQDGGGFMMPQIDFIGRPNIFGPGQNTGITGGMFPRRPMMGTPQMGGGFMTGGPDYGGPQMGGGIWDRFRRMPMMGGNQPILTAG